MKVAAIALLALLALALVADVAADSCHQSCYKFPDRKAAAGFCKKAAVAKKKLLDTWSARSKIPYKVKAAKCNVGPSPDDATFCDFRIIYSFPTTAARDAYQGQEHGQKEYVTNLQGTSNKTSRKDWEC